MVALLASSLHQRICSTLDVILPDNRDPQPVPLPGELRRVAVVGPAFIGDTVLATALLKNLAAGLPRGTALYFIGSAAACSLVETLPGLTRAVTHPKTLSEKKALLRSLRLDAVFLLRYSLTWALAAMDAGIRYRVGQDLERLGFTRLGKWGNLLTHCAPSGTLTDDVHQLERYRLMLSAVGLPWQADLIPEIQTTPADQTQAGRLLKEMHHPRFLLHLSAGSPGKRWPLTYWAELMNLLFDAYGANFVAVGRPDDSRWYQWLETRTGLPILNLCGKTTLRESTALCSQVEAVITLDTGMAHLAAAANTPALVVIYGPTNVRQWHPVISGQTCLETIHLPIPCRPCLTRTCSNRRCLNLLSPVRVFSHVSQALQQDASPVEGIFRAQREHEKPAKNRARLWRPAVPPALQSDRPSPTFQ